MRTLPLLGLLLAVSISVHAEDDLLDVYRLAESNDPVIAQAKANLSATAELQPQARAALLPNIAAFAGYSRVRQEFDTEIGSGTEIASGTDSFPTTDYGLRLTQPIFRYSSFVLLEQVEAQIAASEAQYAAASQNLVLRSAEGYFNVLSAQNTLELANAEQAAVLRQLEQAEQRFEVGLIAITDVHEARAARDLAAAQIIAAENRLASALAALEELTARGGWELAGLEAEIPLSAPEPADNSLWQKAAAEQNWQLIASRYAAEVAMRQIGIRRGDYYPSLDLAAEYGRNIQDGVQRPGDTTTGSVGVQLNVPIYQGGGANARVREAQYRYSAARFELEATRRSVLRLAGDAYRGVLSSILQVQALDQARVSTRSALEATEAGFQAGTRTIVDVLAAQRERFRAQRDFQQARYDYLLNGLRLKQAAATLAPEDLANINRWLKD